MNHYEVDWNARASEGHATTLLTVQAPEAVIYLKSAVRSGTPWPQALLEAIGLWTLPQEVYQGRTYKYLLHREAFDWLLLAERLCEEIYDMAPAEELERLLFDGTLPDSVSQEEFRNLLGGTKYRAYLNYWYGVVMEEALQLAVEEEIRKRHFARCYLDNVYLEDEAFVHLYQDTYRNLLTEFRRQQVMPTDGDMTLTEHKEFTYWLFKRRISLWDPARVASDTRKGLQKLEQLERSKNPPLEPATD